MEKKKKQENLSHYTRLKVAESKLQIINTREVLLANFNYMCSQLTGIIS